MLLYTYKDRYGVAVYDSCVTTSLVQARDHAARYNLTLIENQIEFSSSEMIEDYTPEDESDG